MARKVVILGTGGTSIDILDTINDINRANCSSAYECIGFLDDNQSLWGKTLHGVRVIGEIAIARSLPDCWFVNGIGSPNNFWKRESIIAQACLPPDTFLTIVHPSSSVSRTASLGRGTVIFQNATITSNVRLGDQVTVLPNSVVSHDDTIGDYTCIAGGVCISGGVRIGRLSYLGTNSSVIGNVAIGDYCLIGMGSVVLSDVPTNSVVVGNPAKVLRQTLAVDSR